MTAVVIPFDRSPFTPEDEALMAAVATQLARFGLVVERNKGRGFDGYRIRPSHTPLARWVVLRFRNGQYQLRDGILDVLAQGPTLESVVFPGWRMLRTRENTATTHRGRVRRPLMTDGRARRQEGAGSR